MAAANVLSYEFRMQPSRRWGRFRALIWFAAWFGWLLLIPAPTWESVWILGTIVLLALLLAASPRARVVLRESGIGINWLPGTIRYRDIAAVEIVERSRYAGSGRLLNWWVVSIGWFLGVDNPSKDWFGRDVKLAFTKQLWVTPYPPVVFPRRSVRLAIDDAEEASRQISRRIETAKNEALS